MHGLSSGRVPDLLSKQTKNFIGKEGRVELNVAFCEHLVRLHLVEDADELVLDEAHEDKVDGRVVGDGRRIGRDEVR